MRAPAATATRTVPSTVGELLEIRARERGATAAVLAPNRPAMTYELLAERAATHRAKLRDWGIGPRDRVALVLGDGYDTAVSALYLSASTICVSLSPALKEPELDTLFARLRPRAVVVSGPGSAAARVAGRTGAGVLVMDATSGELRMVSPPVGRPGGVAGDPSGAPDVALILATSGTTGRSKLVPLTHRGVLAAASATVGAYALTPEDRRLNVMPLYHVQGLVGSLLASLVAGGGIICTTGFDAARVPGWVRTWRATWYSATPTMHREIMRTCGDELAGLGADGLRFLRAGSAALPAALRSELEQRFGLPVVESYGMTEAHQIASTPLDPALHRPGSVGRPTGSEVLVLGPDGRSPAAPGQIGEVVVRGDNVFGGYYDEEGEESPFVHGWFRTGDVGLMDADGYLFLRGRLKEIINRGGEKISPREVDEVLLAHPAVAEAVTFPAPEPRLGEDVAAAVVLADGATATEPDLRAFAGSRLAAHKVPRRIVLVDRIPNSGGKVRRNELAQLLGVDMTTAADDRPVVDVVELTVTGIWKEVLGLTEVGPEDDFFFLGGDSLTGVKVLQMVGDVFDVELSPLAMYDQASTVRSMAALVRAARAARH